MSSPRKGRSSPNKSPRSVNSRGTGSQNTGSTTPPNTPPASHTPSWFYDDTSPFRYDLRWNFSPKTPEKSLLDLLSPSKSPLQFFSPGKSPFAGLPPEDSPLTQRPLTPSPLAVLSPKTLSLLSPKRKDKSPIQVLSSWQSCFSSPVHIAVSAGMDDTNVPTTVEEMDAFLASAWKNEEPVSSQYSSKLSDLFHFYTSKLAEIDTAERTSLADNLSQAGSSSLNSIDDCFKDAQIRTHYDAARKRLKEETVQSILRLKVKSPARSANAKACTQNNNSSATGNGSKTPNQKSPKKPTKGRKPQSDRKALDTESILNQWFEEHSERPYPNKKQKEDLAKRCNITVKQVITWFNNKRYRSNCTKTKKGKGKK